MQTEKYIHYGAEVTVISEVKGKHKELCLCSHCELFNPKDPILNCHIAQSLYQICVDHHMVTPVFECATFVHKND